MTEYVIRAETAAAALRNAGETVSDSLVIAMIVKGLPNCFQSFVAVLTQSEKKQSISDFNVALRSFEETEKSRQHSENSILKSSHGPPTTTRWKHGATSSIIILTSQRQPIRSPCRPILSVLKKDAKYF